MTIKRRTMTLKKSDDTPSSPGLCTGGGEQCVCGGGGCGVSGGGEQSRMGGGVGCLGKKIATGKGKIPQISERGEVAKTPRITRI